MVAILALLVAGATLGVLLFLPVSRAFSFVETPPACLPDNASWAPPNGALVHGTWNVLSGANASVAILESDGARVCDGEGTSDSFQLEANGGTYLFQDYSRVWSGSIPGCVIVPPVTFSGTYVVPLW